MKSGQIAYNYAKGWLKYTWVCKEMKLLKGAEKWPLS